MKKMISIILIVLLVLPLSACGAKKQDSASKTSNKVSSIETEKSNAKAIEYLPAYNSTIKAKSFVAANKNNKSSVGTYTLKSTTSDKVFSNYEKILKDDGWKIYQSIKAHSISAKKGTHDTTIMIQQLKKDVNLTISSK